MINPCVDEVVDMMTMKFDAEYRHKKKKNLYH